MFESTRLMDPHSPVDLQQLGDVVQHLVQLVDLPLAARRLHLPLSGAHEHVVPLPVRRLTVSCYGCAIQRHAHDPHRSHCWSCWASESTVSESLERTNSRNSIASCSSRTRNQAPRSRSRSRSRVSRASVGSRANVTCSAKGSSSAGSPRRSTSGRSSDRSSRQSMRSQRSRQRKRRRSRLGGGGGAIAAMPICRSWMGASRVSSR